MMGLRIILLLAASSVAASALAAGAHDERILCLCGLNQFELCLSDAGGGNGHPIWSPDGRWIAFASSRTGWKDEGMFFGGQAYGEIVVMHADGSAVRQLTDDQWEEGPEWWLPEKTR